MLQLGLGWLVDMDMAPLMILLGNFQDFFSLGISSLVTFLCTLALLAACFGVLPEDPNTFSGPVFFGNLGIPVRWIQLQMTPNMNVIQIDEV